MSPPLPSMMKAVRRKGSGPLETTLAINDQDPMPKHTNNLPPGHVLVKVAYTSLNPFDYKVAEAPVIGTWAFKGIPCLDFAGTVVRSTDSEFQEGSKVFGQTQPMNFGACAQYIVVAAQLCNRVPENVGLEDAATFGIAGLTAYQMIVPFIGNGGGRKKILINGGSGGLGTYAIQIAKALGCYVTATCSGANTDLCREIGADEVINYQAKDVVDTLKQSGKQYDLIVDPIFSDLRLYWESHQYLDPRGSYVTVLGGLNLKVVKQLMTIFLWPRALGGGQRPFQIIGRSPSRCDYTQLAEWTNDGVVKPVIEQIYDMEDIGAAFERIKSGRARGKLVVRIAN
ncbi:zinc alcohol dehydrogenase [Fusarium mexicanum]|uniref:Zinc alcohol dehydrogenase n=1 Tax=Fusarium mexicanum TaxID=751941 RepID=A0A8H5IIM6_9HYPO|nr:zinc alcohol dehydrogenase [Fusarium mexicanum]